jgi:elongation factor Ts
VHHDGKLAVLAEVACETDFVARNEEFEQFGADLCLHIAAMNPACMTAADIDEDLLARERRVQEERAQETMAGKPAEIIAKAVEGRVKSFLKERCLMDQLWVKDDSQSVEAVCKAKVGTIGENIQIRRFVRMELGG